MNCIPGLLHRITLKLIDNVHFSYILMFIFLHFSYIFFIAYTLTFIDSVHFSYIFTWHNLPDKSCVADTAMQIELA